VEIVFGVVARVNAYPKPLLVLVTPASLHYIAPELLIRIAVVITAALLAMAPSPVLMVAGQLGEPVMPMLVFVVGEFNIEVVVIHIHHVAVITVLVLLVGLVQLAVPVVKIV
jgi:hypothetical protein